MRALAGTLMASWIWVSCLPESPPESTPIQAIEPTTVQGLGVGDPVPALADEQHVPPPPAAEPTAGGPPPCSRSPADIMTVVGTNSARINKCLMTGQKRKRLSKGTRTVDLRFLVLPSGRIDDIQVSDEDTRDNTVETCIKKALRRVKLAAVKGGECPMTVPFNVALPSPRSRKR